MLILLDVGNTAVTYGIYKEGKFLAYGSCLINDIPKIIKKWTKSGGNESNNIIISSVVPNNTDFLVKYLAPIGHLWIVGKNLPLPIKHRYRFPKKLGVDRIVNIYGALKKYRPPFLIIDYGTAITFDYVSAKGVFEGGMIVPGPELSLQALIQRAALLPKKIRLPKKAASFIGRSTLECLTSGILEGYGALTDGLVERFKKRYGPKLFVLGTGGFLTHLRPSIHSIDRFDPFHSLHSLVAAFKEQSQV